MALADIIYAPLLILLVGFTLWYADRWCDPDLILPAGLQALRWASAGLVIAVVADLYLNATLLTAQLFWGTVGVVMLFGIEHHLLRIEKAAKEDDSTGEEGD